MGDSEGNITYTLLRRAQYLKNNRLTPKGFDKTNVTDDVAVFETADKIFQAISMSAYL